MQKSELSNYWNKIYSKKEAETLNWYHADQVPSLKMIETTDFEKDIKIIEVGGGDCFFVEKLLNLGFEDITVVEISDFVIERAKQRMGEKANKIKWVNSSILDFETTEKYDLWHDRAVFHFLTDIKDIIKYKDIALNSISDKGKIIMATFSELGPDTCCGLPVTQYSESLLYKLFTPEFHMVRWHYYDHLTPSKIKQNYIYSCFAKV